VRETDSQGLPPIESLIEAKRIIVVAAPNTEIAFCEFH
jgi:hypothetical protein